MIFVFGSNLAGIHGAGAARYAVIHEGAIPRMGFGPQGNSYALPTKGYQIETLPLHIIKINVNTFIEHARLNPDLEFKVTRIGCGLAGFTDEQIAPMFANAPDNCYFDSAWSKWLGIRKYWGHQ